MFVAAYFEDCFWGIVGKSDNGMYGVQVSKSESNQRNGRFITTAHALWPEIIAVIEAAEGCPGEVMEDAIAALRRKVEDGK